MRQKSLMITESTLSSNKLSITNASGKFECLLLLFSHNKEETHWENPLNGHRYKVMHGKAHMRYNYHMHTIWYHNKVSHMDGRNSRIMMTR